VGYSATLAAVDDAERCWLVACNLRTAVKLAARGDGVIVAVRRNDGRTADGSRELRAGIPRVRARRAAIT